MTNQISKFTYDGDGARVLQVQISGTQVITTAYAGPLELQITATQRITKTYYSAGTQLIAMRVYTAPSSSVLYFLHGDHLGSTSLTTNSSGNVVARQLYDAWGNVRYVTGTLPTDISFTGRHGNLEIGLYFFQARFYDASLGRFLSADTIVPDGKNPQQFNRYAYGLNNPVKYIDPTGHKACEEQWGCDVAPNLPKSKLFSPWPEPLRDQLLGDEAYGTRHYRALEQRAEQAFLQELTPPTSGDYNPFGGPNTLGGAGRHAAVDSRDNRLGKAIYAAAYGVVVSVGHSDFGNHVVIEHDEFGVKLYSVYAHLDTQSVTEGDIVDSDTQVGTMGIGNGNVHLHFEVRKAENVDLSSDADHDPFNGQIWWPTTYTQLRNNFVDLGPIFGYQATFADWRRENP